MAFRLFGSRFPRCDQSLTLITASVSSDRGDDGCFPQECTLFVCVSLALLFLSSLRGRGGALSLLVGGWEGGVSVWIMRAINLWGVGGGC